MRRVAPSFKAFSKTVPKSLTMNVPSRNFGDEAAEKPTGSIVKRFVVTAEVTISKLFPAGFGWQAGSIVAAQQGFGASDLGFFALTGAGDFAGVLLGHSIFYTLKSFIDPSIKASQEIQVFLL